jgi:hypothetical protein
MSLGHGSSARASLYQRRLHVDVNPHSAGVVGHSNLTGNSPEARRGSQRRLALRRAHGSHAHVEIAGGQGDEKRVVPLSACRQNEACRTVPDAPGRFGPDASFTDRVGTFEELTPAGVRRSHEKRLPRKDKRQFACFRNPWAGHHRDRGRGNGVRPTFYMRWRAAATTSAPVWTFTRALRPGSGLRAERRFARRGCHAESIRSTWRERCGLRHRGLRRRSPR